MDRYNERLIVVRPNPIVWIALLGCVILTLIGAVLVILSPPLGVLIFAGGIALIFFTKDGLHQEIEFIITNGDIEIARIINKKKRKVVGVVEASDIAKMDWAKSDKVQNDLDISKLKTRSFVGIEPGDNVVAIYAGEGDKQELIIMDFDEKCVDHMKSILKVKSEIK